VQIVDNLVLAEAAKAIGTSFALAGVTGSPMAGVFALIGPQPGTSGVKNTSQVDPAGPNPGGLGALVERAVNSPFGQSALQLLHDVAVTVITFVVVEDALTSSNQITSKGTHVHTDACYGRCTIIVAPTIVQQLGDVASRYGNLECDKAAEALKDVLISNRLNGELLVLTFPNAYNGYVTSNAQGGTIAISHTGMHQGIKYNGLVHCNVHPYGLSEPEWIDDFNAAFPPKLLSRALFLP